MSKRLIVQNAPVMFGVECSGVVVHPVVVECRKEEDVVTHLSLDGRNCSQLVLFTRNSGTIGNSILRPSSLGNTNANVVALPASATCSEILNLFGDEVTSLVSSSVGVEEAVNVGSNVVTSSKCAEHWVGEDGILTIDVDDGTTVSMCTQDNATLGDGANDLSSTSLTTVNIFVSNANRVNDGPVVLIDLDGFNDGFELVGKSIIKPVNAQENTLVVLLCKSESNVRLIAVSAVNTDGLESAHLGPLAIGVFEGFASRVRLVALVTSPGHAIRSRAIVEEAVMSASARLGKVIGLNVCRWNSWSGS